MIEDLSSVNVPTGSFELIVTLTDGKDNLITDVLVIVYAAPIFEDQSAAGDFGYFEGVTEENSDEDGAAASNSTSTVAGSSSEEDTEIQQEVEKWRFDMWSREQELYFKQG